MRSFRWSIPVTLMVGLSAVPATTIHAQSTADRVRMATEGLRFREVGPTIMGGRVSDLAVVESDPRIFYVGTATGGIWKTENAGITFTALFTDEETSSIGDVTVAPSNPNVIWVGTGEPQNRQSSPWGNGVYRSVDGGTTWRHLGLSETHHISRIQVHPRDPDVAYVAAVGHLWGPNPERGVYRTRDGGRSWDQVLFIDDDTGVIDLVMDPNDPMALYAATYQRRRRAWGFNGGGPGSGIHRTLDGGDSWTELTDGLPEGNKGRIGLDVFRGDGRFVCAIVEADARAPGAGFGDGGRENGVYCSTDRGNTWEMRSDTNNRPMYYSQIRIDPNDAERIYLGGSNLFRSSDGGRTFTDDAAEGVHLDHHALWIDPNDSDHLLLGSDGGVSVSWDRSDSWYQFRNLPLAQFYEIGVDMRDPYHVCGGLQDNGSWCAPSDTRSNQGIRTRDWYNVGSGDGFFTVMTADTMVMFAQSQGGNLTRVDLRTNERSRIRPEGVLDDEGNPPELRWNWDSPSLVSSHDPNTVYIGSNMLFRSRDLGQSWEAVSGDLTYAVDREELELMGVAGSEAQMSLNDGQSSYGNLTAIAESPLDPGVLYAGADDGRLHVTRDGGASWTDITGNVPGLPDNTYVTRIVASNGTQGHVYAAFDGHRSDDFSAYVYESRDYGRSWRPIVAGLPESSINALEQHPRRADLLFVGNEIGVYVSIDGGAQWVRMDGGLPTVPVDDIVIHPRENDLVLGTHGRGIWIMDDIGPLEALTPSTLTADAHLFDVRRATSYNLYTPQGWTPGIWEAENPGYGARIRYWLGSAVDTVTLTVTDPSGTTVRALGGSGAVGLHEVVWDLRLVEENGDSEDPEDEPTPGPRVLPGRYSVQMEAGERTDQTDIEVRLDPRVGIDSAVLAERQAQIMDSYRLGRSVNAAGNALDRIQERLEEVRDLLNDTESDAALRERTDELMARADSLEEALDDVSDGAGVWGRIQGVSGPATADQRRSIERSWRTVPPLIESINGMITQDMVDLNRRLDEAGVRRDPGPPVPLPRRVGR